MDRRYHGGGEKKGLAGAGADLEITGKSLTEVAKGVMPFLFLLLICLMNITYALWISLVLPRWLMP